MLLFGNITSSLKVLNFPSLPMELARAVHINKDLTTIAYTIVAHNHCTLHRIDLTHGMLGGLPTYAFITGITETLFKLK